jgi:putative tricarboxylic transport membrane protein
MKRAEAAAALVLMGVAIFVCNGAVKLTLGTPSEPGPGFLPFWTGALMGCLALLHLIRSVLPRETSGESGGLGVEEKWHRAAAVVASILGYALILPHVGYLITTFLLMVVLFSLYRRMKWWAVVGWSVAVIGVTYLVFHGWLKIQFPVGVLG